MRLNEKGKFWKSMKEGVLWEAEHLQNHWSTNCDKGKFKAHPILKEQGSHSEIIVQELKAVFMSMDPVFNLT